MEKQAEKQKTFKFLKEFKCFPVNIDINNFYAIALDVLLF